MYGLIMSSDLVVKSNRLNMAIQNLTLPELRIIQLAIVDARETGKGLHTDTPLRIDALRYAEAFNTTRQNAYILMKQSENRLFNRMFTFTDKDDKPIKSRWVQDVRYLDDEGSIEICFTRSVVQAITRIDGAEEFFTQYLLSQTANLDSVYSVRLYELLAQWKSVGKTPIFELQMFRKQLGIKESEYKIISNFKMRVLDLAVNEINSKTDLEILYIQEKKGRLIHGFKFSVKVKKTETTKKEGLKDVHTIDMFTQMTEKQIASFSQKLAQLPELSHMATGEAGRSYDAFAQLIAKDLKNPLKQMFYKPYLEKVGFKQS